MTENDLDKLSERIRQQGIAEITAPNRIITKADIAAHELDHTLEEDGNKSYNAQEVPLVKPSNLGLVLLGILAVAALLFFGVPMFI